MSENLEAELLDYFEGLGYAVQHQYTIKNRRVDLMVEIPEEEGARRKIYVECATHGLRDALTALGQLLYTKHWVEGAEGLNPRNEYWVVFPGLEVKRLFELPELFKKHGIQLFTFKNGELEAWD